MSNLDDKKAEWLSLEGNPPTSRNLNEAWPCGCSLAEYLNLENGDKTFGTTSLCREHQVEFEEWLEEEGEEDAC